MGGATLRVLVCASSSRRALADLDVHVVGGAQLVEARAQRLGLAGVAVRPQHAGAGFVERGQGGFAAVWRALDKAHDVPVALKVLHAQHVHNAERRGRFFRGARVMAQLDHANIVKIILPWASDGEYEYYVIHYVAGGTLRN